ncbi:MULTISPECIES: cold shock domain-containing protein [Pseudonocardia]|nr:MULTISPECIES: cold shock domain-containing protein [Pseudonocardia]BBF99479.1 hypothetical protein Pdca_06890 [Pseudonocardia autotrophica]GEC28480.1 hypothetical protein PSA01_55090 [Pseudonocardia saturnea]
MSTPGEVRVWHDEEGWGVIDSPATPGGCWAHYSDVAVPGLRALHRGRPVELEWEPVEQDGFGFRAVRVRPRGEEPYDRPPRASASEDGTAYRSTLTISFDEPPT